MCAAPKNNQFWKLRSKHGRDRIFTTPEIMKEAAYEYFKWCEQNPIYEVDFMNCGKLGVKEINKPKMRVFSLTGLCIYLHVNTVYFLRFENSIKEKTDQLSEDFRQVITCIREIIETQQLSGAAAGFLNPNIIARKLGLVDKTEVDQKVQANIILKVDEDDLNL